MAIPNYWPLQDNDASTTVVNTGTSGVAGTLQGGDNTSAKASSGPGTALTNAFDLNGTDDVVDISGSSINLTAGTAFSFSCWVYMDVSGQARIIGVSGSGNNFIRINTTTTVEYRTSTTTTFTVPAFSAGVWYHLLITRTTGNSVRCFIDGTESSSGALSNAAAFAPSVLGKQNSNFHNGRLCAPKFYDTDESANAAAIMAEANAGGGSGNSRYYRTQQALVI